ncbi:hypothetical protein RhoFasB10_04574 [Rhodococcus sp. B10]|nr:hypothetical protein [Rhodococcus sp. B10]
MVTVSPVRLGVYIYCRLGSWWMRVDCAATVFICFTESGMGVAGKGCFTGITLYSVGWMRLGLHSWAWIFQPSRLACPLIS